MKSVATLFREAYGGLSRTIWLLSLTQLINRSGTMVVFFLSVYLRDDLAFTLPQVGIAMSLFGAGTLLGVFVGGRLVDRIGYYPVMVWSLLLGGVAFIIVSLLRDYLAVCIGLFILSALGEAFRPANMAAISYYSTPETYTRSVSLNRLAINLGFSVGPAVGGLIAMISYQWIFWADGITCIGAFLLLVFFIRKRTDQAVGSPKAEDVSLRSPYRDKAFLAFLPLVTLYAVAFFQFFSTMPLYYKQVEGFTEAQIGWLMAINGLLVAGLEMILIYKIEHKRSPFTWIAFGSLLLAGSYLMLLLVGGWWWLFVLTIIISFSEMFAMPFMNTFMNSRASAGKQGQFASLYIMAWSAAQILTPLIATNVIAVGGYSMLWWLLAAFALLVVVGVRVVERTSLLRD